MSAPTTSAEHGGGLYSEFGRGIVAEAEYRTARADAMRDIAREYYYQVPRPDRVARTLPLWAAEALRRAYISNDLANAGCYRVSHSLPAEDRCWLASGGLIEINGPYLTAFGSKVRKALLDDDR